ncbi:T9SS type A sorting domain-containing protein [Ekhidna sp.]|uniref:T9SS type A sorting domain-containing protein n=1 Tax=Ekhidna sp. TaxID=2608089 RepID=UPI0032EECE10
MKKSIITFSFFVFFTSLFAQDYYWVGGSGNWSDYDNHWATSSGGTTFHTQAPTSSDNVIFDVNSFDSFGQVVTLDIEANCLSMDWSGATNFPTINGNDNDINIYGSVTLSADMTADFDGIEFESNTTGNTITTNGTYLGDNSLIRLNGVGGEWSLLDNFHVKNFYFNAGTFNTNGNDILAETRFTTSGTSDKVINLGNSEITTDRWWINGSNITINAGTSKILTDSFYGDQAGDGPFTYYDLEFLGGFCRLRNNAAFNEITFPAGLELALESGDVFTVDNLVSEGTKFDPVDIYASTTGSEATFTSASGSISIDYVELQDVHATGGASFSANNSIDNGNNTGWSISAPVSQSYYWVGDEGDWTEAANHWANSSGGSTFYTDYPSRYDNVFFDANSFTQGAQTITVDIENAECASIDWTGVTNAPTFSVPFGNNINVFGSATFTDDVDKDVSGYIKLKGRGNHTLTLGSGGNVTFLSVDCSGSYDVMDDLEIGRNLLVYGGTLNLNGFNVNATASNSEVELYGNDVVLNAGSGTITTAIFSFLNSSSTPTFNADNSTLIVKSEITIASSVNKSLTFNDLVLDGSVYVEGSHTIENLTILSGSNVSFEESSTNIINGDLTLNGTKPNPITISSDLSGTQATLSKSSGTVDGIYLILEDMVATGGATFNADQTIDNGNNSGWNITEPTGADYYWVGDGGDWSDYANHWAITSGGSTFHDAAPGVLDNVIFDANSFSTDLEVVTIDQASASCHDFDASGVDQLFYLSNSTKELNVYGSLTRSVDAIFDVGTINFLSSDTETIDFAGGPGSTKTINILSSGEFILLSDLVTRDIDMESGTLNTDGFSVTALNFNFLGDESKVLNLGTSVLDLSSWRSDAATNTTINGGSSEVTISGTILFSNDAGSSWTLNNLTLQDDVIIYNDLTVNTLTIEPDNVIKWTVDLTIETNELIIAGTEEMPITLEPQVAGTTLTFSQSSGVVNGDYLLLENVTATGGATFNALNSVDNGNVVGWIFSRLPQTITFDALDDKTYGDAPFTLEATASSGLDVSFQLISGPASLDGDQLTITGVGTVQVRAEQSGNIDYEPAPSVLQTFDVEKASQTITFSTLETKTYGDDSFILSATGGASSSPVSFESSNPDVATVDGNEVTIVGAGSTTITASQDGDENYLSAADVEQLLTVNKADQTITFDEIADYEIGVDTEPIMLAATSSSGLEITYAIDGPANLDGNELTPTGVGTVSITASQPGNSNYNAADDVEVSFEVTESTTLGISKVVLHIYPNPALSHFELRGLNGINIASIAIYSLNGELVKTYKEAHGPKKVGELSPGVYFVKVHQENKGFHTARLVVR